MVGALCNNGIGVCGVNQVVKVMGCKFLDGSGNGYTSDAVRCLDYAQRMGADITLNSYGGLYADSYALQSAIQAAEDKGQLFVTAAGNDYGTFLIMTQLYWHSQAHGLRCGRTSTIEVLGLHVHVSA